MAMTFNQFQRELRKRGIEGQTAVILTTMYEQILEQGKQLDMCANILMELTETVGNVTELHKHTQGRLKDLNQRVKGGVDGVELDSVPLRDEPTEH